MVKQGSVGIDAMQNEGLSIAAKGGLEVYVADSNESVLFRMIRNESELKRSLDDDNEDDDSNSFLPEMTHQIYGDKEHIFGYRGLKIDLWMSAASLKAYVRMRADETMTLLQSEGVKPDPVVPPLLKILADGQGTESLDEFSSEILSDKETKFKPHGEKITEFEVYPKAGGGCKTYEIYYCDIKVPGFKDYHRRLQPWIMFFIDAASYIDDADDNWRFFLLFERYKTSEGNNQYAVAGYTTVYQYYAYPEHMRPRISQMLVLPPFQKQGLGAKLLDTVCKYYWNNPKIVDITVEDPSDDFIRLRDFVDIQNALKLLDCFSSVEKVEGGFNENMTKESNEKLRLCKRQARRVYEIARLHFAKKAGPLTDDSTHFRAYRIDVKKRLNIPFMKEAKQLEKLKKALNPEEFAAATINITNREQRLENLQAQFNELNEHYKQILERISAT